MFVSVTNALYQYFNFCRIWRLSIGLQFYSLDNVFLSFKKRTEK